MCVGWRPLNTESAGDGDGDGEKRLWLTGHPTERHHIDTVSQGICADGIMIPSVDDHMRDICVQVVSVAFHAQIPRSFRDAAHQIWNTSPSLGWNCREVGVEPPISSCLQTLIFE